MKVIIYLILTFELIAYLIVSFIAWDFLWLNVWNWSNADRLILLICGGGVALLSFIFKLSITDLKDIFHD